MGEELNNHVVTLETDLRNTPTAHAEFAKLAEAALKNPTENLPTVAFGDGHGNALQLFITRLAQANIFKTVTDAQYKKLGEIHNRHQQLINQLLSEPAKLTPEAEEGAKDLGQETEVTKSPQEEAKTQLGTDITEVRTILAELFKPENINNKHLSLSLLGDLLSDRGPEDLFTLLIIKGLKDAGVSFEIIVSNHDAHFMASHEGGIFKNSTTTTTKWEATTWRSPEYKKAQKAKHQLEKSSKKGRKSRKPLTIAERERLDAQPVSDRISSKNYHALMQAGIITEEEHNKLVETYKGTLKLLSYNLSVQHGRNHIAIRSHAPIDFWMIEAAIKQLNEMEYDGKDTENFNIEFDSKKLNATYLAEIIKQINTAFQKKYIEASKLHEIVSSSAIGLIYWNRPIGAAVLTDTDYKNPTIRKEFEETKKIKTVTTRSYLALPQSLGGDSFSFTHGHVGKKSVSMIKPVIFGNKILHFWNTKTPSSTFANLDDYVGRLDVNLTETEQNKGYVRCFVSYSGALLTPEQKILAKPAAYVISLLEKLIEEKKAELKEKTVVSKLNEEIDKSDEAGIRAIQSDIKKAKTDIALTKEIMLATPDDRLKKLDDYRKSAQAWQKNSYWNSRNIAGAMLMVLAAVVVLTATVLSHGLLAVPLLALAAKTGFSVSAAAGIISGGLFAGGGKLLADEHMRHRGYSKVVSAMEDFADQTQTPQPARQLEPEEHDEAIATVTALK